MQVTQGAAKLTMAGKNDIRNGGKATLYQELKRKILALELKPDSNLEEVQLSTEYGISRTPVREVLRQLAGEGYVEIRENRGARVIPMDHSTLRDFFLIAPMIYEAVARLALQNFTPLQMKDLKATQKRFKSARLNKDGDAMAVENNRFHEIIGEMSHSVFLKPSLSKLLIDHARIGHTFFRPAGADMEASLESSCNHHDQMIEAITRRDEAVMVQLVLDHWELSRKNMEIYVAPPALESEAMRQFSAPRGGKRP
jgi:DNA-binding GntR family transcriptional regulator